VHHGTVLFDNGVLERVERVTDLQQRVLRALWEPLTAAVGYQRLLTAEGAAAVREAVDDLRARAMLFDSRADCDAFYDRMQDERCPRVPFVDQVELTNVCPMRCGFCPRGVPGKMQRPKGHMSFELFEKLLHQMNPSQARYRPLELHHLGESLVHPQLVRFVEAASRRGLPTEMSVNPSLLAPPVCKNLLRAGIRRLVCSLDGMDDATLIRIRGPAAPYTKAERNLEHLLEACKAMASPPTIVIQMIDLHANRHQRDAFLARWASTGLPFVEAYVKDLDGPDPDLGRETAKPLVYLCGYPWRSVVVLWDGRVVPCCRDDDARHVLGDLNEQTLEEIWAGERVKDLRAAHRSGRFCEGHLCAGCAWSRERFAEAMPSRHPDAAKPNPLQW
jgi:radical SAM protein with 4Fe4S-binding SPASM domain